MKARHFLLAVAAIILAACKEPEPVYEINLNDASQASLSFAYQGASAKISFTSEQEWTAVSTASWMTVTPASGPAGSASVNIVAVKNEDDTPRTGYIRISSGPARQEITVTQAETGAIIIGSPTVEMPSEGGQVVIKVTSNLDYKAVSDSDWATVVMTKALSESSFTISVAESTVQEERTAHVTVSADDVRQIVTVKQLAYVPPRKTAFDESEVVASFGVMSDVHIQSGNNMPSDKFKSALSQLKARAAVSDKDGLDGILIAGDMIQTGCSTNEITTFRNTYRSELDPVTVPLVYCLGNHDVTSWWTANMVNDGKVFRNIYGPDFYGADVDKENGEALECRHARICGVNILTISPIGNTPVRFDSRAMSWLDSRLAEITSADPESYVLILLHAMIQNTVYGSNLVSAGYESADADVASYWYTSALTSILNKYPQAVTFSGHLHFPINDPRSIWQGGFTALGCGSVRYMAFEGGSYYINKSSNTVLSDSNDFSQGYLLQLDAGGNMRLTRMDFFHNQTIGDAWDLRYPDPAGKSHLDAFSSARRSAENVAPKLGSLEVVQTGTSLASVPCLAKWSAAEDEDFAHHYELTWNSPSGSRTVWIMSDFYSHAKASEMKKTWEYNLGSFPAGTYSVSLVAVDPWGRASSPLTTGFTVEARTPSDPSSLPDAYVDFSFDGTIKDVNDKVTVTNYGASVRNENVTVGGVSRTVPAYVTTSKSTYAMCQFKELTSAESMKSLMAGGFTVEAFYLDRNKSDGETHGIVCATEYGGWGLAETTDRRPYFIVGDGVSGNSYKSVYAYAVSSSELTHVVATYDPSVSKIRIYVNGNLQAESGFSSSFFPGIGDSFNRFCLGADIVDKNVSTQYHSTSMVIADAKIYTVALNATQAALAYDKAKKDLGF